MEEVPGGQATVRGSKWPWLAGVSGVVSDLNTDLARLEVLPNGMFTGPGTASSESP